MEAVINGRSFEVAAEPADFWGWVKEGRYDREWNTLSAYLRPEHTFLDLGAWIGSHSIYAATIAKRVVAFEPDPIAHAILIRNAALSPYRFEVSPVAIAGHEGFVRLGSGLLGASTTRRNPAAGGGIGEWQPGQELDAPCATLRAVAEDLRFEDPLFIKMDVEGSEEEILEDVEFFKERKPILYLETHPFWWKDEPAMRKRIEEISKHAMVIGH
jgi:FkbM family methyltransferase